MNSFVGDTVTIELETGIDLSGYPTLYIKFRRPDRTIGKWSAGQSVDDDTVMQYSTDETDFDMPGVWSLQANAKNNPLSKDLHGKWVDLEIFVPYADTTTPPTTAAPTTV